MRKITILFLLLLIPVLLFVIPAYAGTSLSSLSATTDVITVRNKEQLNRIIEQIIEARKASQKALSAEEIAKIKEQAEKALKDAELLLNNDGAMVYTGSQIVE